MNPHYLEIAGHLGAAWLAGSLIGLERSYHGRPAGFRTHALVCLASALLMLITAYHQDWVPHQSIGTNTTLDPQRMAQGIMTGIGFLGAGVIFKEGLTVRGLTTAASIWITAAIGILFGIGFFYPALLGTLATLGTLAAFRFIEARIPSHTFAHHVLRFARDRTLPEADVRRLLAADGFSIANMSHRLDGAGDFFEYRMVIRTADKDALGRLAVKLAALPEVVEFRLSPTGD
jgi:putative Mg2+ transporter-C (MgtC) family protein